MPRRLASASRGDVSSCPTAPGEDQRRLVPLVTRALLGGEEAQTSDGSQIRDFMHVADVAGGFVALLDSAIEGPVNIAPRVRAWRSVECSV